MEGLISTFHIDWKLMIAQLINFILVFLAFYLIAAKPLKKLIADRTEEINTGILNGQKNKELLANTEREYENMLAKGRKEAHEVFQAAKSEAESKKVEMLAEAKQEVDKMIENGKKTLEAEKAKMLNDAKKEIVNLVVQTAEKVLGEKVPATFSDNATKELNNL